MILLRIALEFLLGLILVNWVYDRFIVPLHQRWGAKRGLEYDARRMRFYPKGKT